MEEAWDLIDSSALTLAPEISEPCVCETQNLEPGHLEPLEPSVVPAPVPIPVSVSAPPSPSESSECMSPLMLPQSHCKVVRGAATASRGYCAATVWFGERFCQHLNCEFKHPTSVEEYKEAVMILNNVMQTNPFCSEKICMNLVSQPGHLYCSSCTALHPQEKRKSPRRPRRSHARYHPISRQAETVSPPSRWFRY